MGGCAAFFCCLDFFFFLFCFVCHVHPVLGDYKEPSAPPIQRQINRPLVPHLIVLLFCHVRRRSRNRGDRAVSVFVLHNLSGGACTPSPPLPPFPHRLHRQPAVTVTQSESQVRTSYCRVSRTRHGRGPDRAVGEEEQPFDQKQRS